MFSVAVLFTKYFLAVPFWCEVQVTVEGTSECAKLHVASFATCAHCTPYDYVGASCVNQVQKEAQLMIEKAECILGMRALSGQHLENFGHALVVGLKSCSSLPCYLLKRFSSCAVEFTEIFGRASQLAMIRIKYGILLNEPRINGCE